MRRDLLNRVYEVIVENGAIDELELLSKLQKHYPEITANLLENVLLKLEVAGLVNVTWASKNSKRVEVKSNAGEQATR